MKIYISLFLSLFFIFSNPFSGFSQWAQDTTFKPFEDDKLVEVHGLAVDPDGKIWMQPFGATETITSSRTGQEVQTRVIYIYNADGSPADFSPLFVIEFEDGSGTDTLGIEWTGSSYEGNSGRGVEASISDGHIILSQYNFLYKVDYKTGKGLGKAVVDQCNGAITEASTDESGNIYIGCVAATDSPLIKYDSSLQNPETLFNITEGFSRDFQVSSDGNTIWYAGYTTGKILEYSREDEFSSFAEPDTILRGFKSESFDIHPITGFLWASAGSLNDFPEEPYTPQTWYAFDIDLLKSGVESPVDSIKWVSGLTGQPFDAARPRALDFSPDGKTAYVGAFSAVDTPVDVQKFVTTQQFASTESGNTSELPEGYSLDQNYPNPFNPTTSIRYSINEPAFTTLRVFDMLGREVSILVKDRVSAGTHTVTFDATGLPSGIYIYQLQSNGLTMTKQMSLIK